MSVSLEQVVAFAVRDRTVMDRLGGALADDLVTANPLHRQIVQFANEFSLGRGKLPEHGDWDLWIETLPERQRPEVRESLSRLLQHNVSGHDPTFFGDSVAGILRQAAAKNAQARLNSVPEVTPELIRNLADRVDAVDVGALPGLANLRDLDEWLVAPDKDEFISTGYPTLDKILGGWGKDLSVVFADSNMGKSFLLQNFATRLARKGLRCVHVGCEIRLRPQILRYYREIARADQDTFSRERAKVRANLEQWFRFAQGEVLLLEFPSDSISHEDLRRILDRVAKQVGPVDALIVDYLDLLTVPKGARSQGRYEDLGVVTRGLRSLCLDFDITVLTASQAVRKRNKALGLTLADMGDSYEKVRAADNILSLDQTEEEKENHQARIKLLKVRDHGGKDRSMNMYVNFDIGTFMDLHHPTTVEIMRRWGHLPAQKAPDATLVQSTTPEETRS